MLPPCCHWCVAASRDLAADRFRPTSLRAPGLSSLAEPQERQAAVWHAPYFPQAAASDWPACPISPHTVWSVSQWALLGTGFGSAGYRAQMDRWWGLLPSSPMRAGREGEGDRCVYVPLVAPPHRGQDRCLWHWFWKRQRRRQREISGQGMEGEKGKCNVTVWNLISKICSIKINRGFLWDAESRKGFLSIHKPVHVISSTNIYSALG